MKINTASITGLCVRSVAWAATIAFLGCVVNQRALAQGLDSKEFRQIGAPGLGDQSNGYAWSMAWFNSKLYIGTNHNFLCIIRAGRSGASAEDTPEIPGDCPENILDADLRGRIYEYDPVTNRTKLVFISPTVDSLQSDGTTVAVAMDHGYRTMAVVEENDGTSALYIGTFTTTRVPGPPARILRTVDGRNFDDVGFQVAGQKEFRSFRSMLVHDRRLFVVALGFGSEFSVLLEGVDPAQGAFRDVSGDQFGEDGTAFEIASFKEYLYVGVSRPDGFELLKTVARGARPYQFQSALAHGGFRGADNAAVLSLAPFHDYLYIGTGIFLGSFGADDFRPAAPELLRIRANDTWDIVAGEARTTPDGYKTPLSGRSSGFGNPFTVYIWRIVEHENVLYIGTADLSVLSQYATDLDPSGFSELTEYPNIRNFVDAVGPNEVADLITAVEGGFDLWSTSDGVDWSQVTRSGLGDEFSFGVRNFRSTPIGLFLGSANPFFGLRLYLGQKDKTDSDADSFADAVDNCPMTWNLSQHDLDEDGIGDECDTDKDGDCIDDLVDDNSSVRSMDSSDLDSDGTPDGCDNDQDGDSIPNNQDNCPQRANLDQIDSDGNGVGDVCNDQVTSRQPQSSETSTSSGTPMCGSVGAVIPVFLFGWFLVMRLVHGTRTKRN